LTQKLAKKEVIPTTSGGKLIRMDEEDIDEAE
jgi:hypothetical protein